jgi:radical SAM protein (TIGR01212 family)
MNMNDKVPDSSAIPTRKMWDDKRFYSLNYYLKQTYGEKVYRLSLNGGMTCPNRDGTLDNRGCIFCSAGGSGDFATSPQLSITQQLQQATLRIQNKTDCHKYIAYFQAYTNTYADVSYLRSIYMEAIQSPDVVALSIATRCDCISDEILTLLVEINQIKPVWIELGLQSIHNATHRLIRSGFTYECFLDTVRRLHEAHLTTIVHLILGLPGESKEQMLASIDAVAALPIAGVKLQLLHILEGTDLATYYREHPFWVFPLEEYCDFIPLCLAHLPQHIVIHRITGDGPRDLLIAPKWSTDKKRVLNQINQNMELLDIWQGKYFSPVNAPN